MHLVEALHARRRLLGNAFDACLDPRIERRVLREPCADGIEKRGFLLVRRVPDARRIRFSKGAEVHEQRCVATVVQDHVGPGPIFVALPLEYPMRVIPVLVERLAFVREDRRAARGNRSGGVVLCRVDVARRPAHVGAERLQRFDEHRRLDRHVKRSCDARAAERLSGGEFVADR